MSDEFKKDELSGDADIDRALIWKKARVTKDGDIEEDNLKKTVERIDDIRQKEKGAFKYQGVDGDLLTCALKKPEHSRRVRGIGGYVTPSMYFKVPRGGRRGVNHDDFELMEAKKEISVSREMIKDLYEKIAELQMAMKKDRDNDEKGSCSMKWVKSCSKDGPLYDEVMLVAKQNALLVLFFHFILTLSKWFIIIIIIITLTYNDCTGKHSFIEIGFFQW